ncbi:MAG: hypothetical protein HY055_13475, partial [Magnetospirillum sp.]|nr:hypothetical protein [Magnetospirillum sp.]
MGKPATAEEQEVLFQAIIRKIPSVGNPAKLQEISVLALALMLRRPTDHDLRGELTHQVQAIIAAIKPCHSPEGQRNEMRLAARNCIKVLQTAKEKRLPRPAGDDWAQAKEGTAQHGSAQYGSGKPVRGKPGHPAHEKTEEEEERGPLLAIGALALVIVAIGGWVLFGRSSDEPSSDGTETERFVAQMVASAEGNPPPSHLFGGIIRVTSMNG